MRAGGVEPVGHCVLIREGGVDPGGDVLLSGRGRPRGMCSYEWVGKPRGVALP